MMDFKATKARFEIPKGIIYLDGNSLGPLPKAARNAALNVLENEWGEQLILAWNQSSWMDLPHKVGGQIAKLIGAPENSVATGDTLSIKVYQALHAALTLRPERKIILSDRGNFPTDLYMAQGLIDTMGKSHKLEITAPEAVLERISSDVAVVMLTHVDYRTGRMHDMDAITRVAHEKGALVIWDLAHSAGAVPVDLCGCNADFAVGCSYKFLNGGPGAPAFIYVRPDHIGHINPALAGWMGHEQPFEFDINYRPSPSIERMRVGTPPIIQLRVLEAALDIWSSVDFSALRAKSIELSERFIAGLAQHCPDLKLASPKDPKLRGSQVSFEFDHAYPLVQALIARGVIGDFRAPNIARFGITPLYIDEDDTDQAIGIIADVYHSKDYTRPEFQKRGKVT